MPKAPEAPQVTEAMSFGAFLTRCLPAIMQVMPHVALPSSERINGFPTDLHEAAHRLYFAYKSMVESCEASGWHDDWQRMDFDLRVYTGDVIREDLMIKFAPAEYAAQQEAKDRADKEAQRAARAKDMEARGKAWDAAGVKA